ncbi:hypothetical protein BBP40_004974 [Aspergillus hancockii]|nr:hypothetical protein BBP40_004974 [Aspergillus hancockii]
MSHGRVIQDSDDEDDPLASDYPPPANPSRQTDNTFTFNLDTQNVPLRAQSNHPLTINFDEFLHSQEAAPTGLSSSQQRREERWIPHEAAGGGSIGSMMTEIGLAQRRLFDDDDAQYADRNVLPSTTTASGPSQPNLIPTDEMHLVPVIEINGPQEMGYINNDNGPGYMYQTSDTIAYQYAQTEQQRQVLSSNGFSPSAASYNLFESSLQPSRSSNSDEISLSRPTGAVQIDGHNGPRRWNSMQYMPSSPHDTEPNSSLLSAKASRSKSENAALNVAPQLEIQPQTTESPVVLSHPVAIEIPAEPKKRGRPKKQSAPEAGENHELPPYPANQEASETTNAINTKPEKRKPGRPPKTAKPDSPNPDNQQDHPNPTLNQPEANPPSNEPNHPNPTSNLSPQDPPANGTIRIELPQPNHQNQTEEANPEPPNPPTPLKEPKKKKLKRGKTTSITLQKTYDPDIEPDVIWIDDETPSNPIPNPLEPSHPDTNPATIQPEPPKKRGRKRKKTSEQQALEETQTSTTGKATDSNQETVSVTVIINNPKETNKPDNSKKPTPDNSHNTDINPEETLHLEQATSPLTTNENPPETPKKPSHEPKTPSTSTDDSGKVSSKGPGKHSPISTGKVPYRVGLSRRARIAPLLKIVKR